MFAGDDFGVDFQVSLGVAADHEISKLGLQLVCLEPHAIDGVGRSQRPVRHDVKLWSCPSVSFLVVVQSSQVPLASLASRFLSFENREKENQNSAARHLVADKNSNYPRET